MTYCDWLSLVRKEVVMLMVRLSWRGYGSIEFTDDRAMSQSMRSTRHGFCRLDESPNAGIDRLVLTKDACLEGSGSIRLKKIPGTIEQGVCLVKESSCQKRSPHLCENCSAQLHTADGLEYRSTRFPGKCYRRKSRAAHRMSCSDRRRFRESLPLFCL